MPRYHVTFPVFTSASAVIEAENEFAAIEKADPDTGLCWHCSSLLDVGDLDYDRPTVLDDEGRELIVDGQAVDGGDDA